MLVLLFLSSLPMFPGPRCLKELFARAARSTKAVPRFDYTVLDDTGILLGTVPLCDEHLSELYAAGVRAVVSLNQRWEPQAPGGMATACKRAGLAHLGIPTPDYSSPCQGDIHKAVEYITEQIPKGSVYVHCNAGRGRSAVCALAYLMHSRGLSAREAYELVAVQRRVTPLPSRLLGMPRPQWRALLEFERQLELADPLPLGDNDGE